MKKIDVVRAWKDPDYRVGLGHEELVMIPSNPAGLVELTDRDLKAASGLMGMALTTFRTCTEFTFRRFRCCH